MKNKMHNALIILISLFSIFITSTSSGNVVDCAGEIGSGGCSAQNDGSPCSLNGGVCKTIRDSENGYCISTCASPPMEE